MIVIIVMFLIRTDKLYKYIPGKILHSHRNTEDALIGMRWPKTQTFWTGVLTGLCFSMGANNLY